MGVLGGSFNPPHLGHLALARHALAELDLSGVALVPANASPHKLEQADPGPARRLAMCRLAFAGVEGLSVCALEIERGGASYTVDTLRTIHESHPGAQLTLIVGADVAGTLPSWREPRAILELAGVAVAARENEPAHDLLADLQRLATPRASEDESVMRPGATAAGPGSVRVLAMPNVDVSSSLVRERARAGEPTTELVGPAVAAYIAEQGLYLDEGRRA